MKIKKKESQIATLTLYKVYSSPKSFGSLGPTFTGRKQHIER